MEVRVGDIGIISDYQYRRVSSLADFGFEFGTRKDDSRAIMQYSTENAVSVEIGGGAQAGVPGVEPVQGKLSVKFRSSDAVLFQAGNCHTLSIDNQHALGEKVLEMSGTGDWPDNYVVVTDVVSAEVTTILISSGSQAEAEFSVKADLNLQSTSLANADTNVRLLRAKNIGTQIVAQRGLTPLFKAQGVVRRLIRPPSFGPQRGLAKSAGQFGALDYDDFA